MEQSRLLPRGLRAAAVSRLGTTLEISPQRSYQGEWEGKAAGAGMLGLGGKAKCKEMQEQCSRGLEQARGCPPTSSATPAKRCCCVRRLQQCKVQRVGAFAARGHAPLHSTHTTCTLLHGARPTCTPLHALRATHPTRTPSCTLLHRTPHARPVDPIAHLARRTPCAHPVMHLIAPLLTWGLVAHPPHRLSQLVSAEQ